MSTFTIFLLIGVAAFFGALYAIRRAAKNHTPAGAASGEAPGNELAGVAGWLLFLIAVLVFISPAMGIARHLFDIREAEMLYPTLAEAGPWRAMKYAGWVVILVCSVISIHAGLGLARKRDRSVVRQAQIALWVIGPLATVVMLKGIPMLITGKGIDDGIFYLWMAVSVTGASIWTAYLSLSRRVKATYAAA